MPHRFQVVIDATDAHRLAAFWAVALDYVHEDNSPLIRRLLDAGVITEEDITSLDGRLVWRTAAAIRHPDDPVNADTGTGLGRRVLFQSVAEPGSPDARDDADPSHLSGPKTSKNRVHLDVQVGSERQEAHVAGLKELGATFLWTATEGDHGWVTMADPEGNEFCVV
jgi:hypothetical protein